MDLTFQGDRLAGAVALRFFAVRLSFPIRHLTSIEYILSVLQMEVESRVRKRLNSATTSNPEEKRMDRPDTKINRRKFLQKGAVVAAGSATLSTTALSYARIAGANDRISLGHIGIGNRGRELDGIVALLKDKKNVEVTAVCDLWAHNREQAVPANQRYFGNRTRSLQHPLQRLVLKEVDA